MKYKKFGTHLFSGRSARPCRQEVPGAPAFEWGWARYQRIGSLFMLFCLVAAGSAQAHPGHEHDLCSIARESMQHASSIRGLRPKRSVPCLVHDKEKVKSYLVHTIATKLAPGKLAMEELVYRKLGIIPDSYDYEHGVVDLYLSQIGGYYDPDKNHFVMAGWMPELLQATVAVHELTHGLQDQYFDLGTLIDPLIDNSDMLLARSALVEGDASAVMLDYNRKLSGQGPLSREPNVDAFMFQNIVGLSVMGAGLAVPESLKLMLLFPYTSGVRFTHSLLQRNGYKAVDDAFHRPPRSSEEILHPEKYLKQERDFAEIGEEELRLAAGGSREKLVYQDTIGEFGISALLGQYAENRLSATQAAAGWGGDRVGVFETGGKRQVVWLTKWDTAADSEEFFSAFKASLKKRFSDLEGRLANGTISLVKETGSSVLFSVQE